MTDTTTDAAEARAWTDAQLKDAVTELLSHRGERPWRVLRGGQELWETWLPAFRAALRYLPATAEAASGAGEREVAGRDAAAWVNSIKGVKPTDQFIALDRRAFEDCITRVLASLPPATDPAMVERVAKALGLHRYPGGDSRNNPPSRWPTSPQDTLSGRDSTVPLAWDFAEKCRADARVMLAALAAAPTIPATGEAGQ